MIWVISHMHLNKGWNPKVRPPRLPEERKGLFSTRSPHRPNAIALSSLRVGRVDVSKGVIHVHGLDLLDGEGEGTPCICILGENMASKSSPFTYLIECRGVFFVDFMPICEPARVGFGFRVFMVVEICAQYVHSGILAIVCSI